MDSYDKNICRSILVIEDEKVIQETLKDVLEIEGYNVFTANNGKLALEMLPTIHPPCLILLDLMMPVMNGWEFADAILKDKSLAHIPVVLITAYGDRANLIPSKGIVKKPIDLDILLKIVKKWCDEVPAS